MSLLSTRTLPDTLLSSVRAGFDAFAQLFRMRLSQDPTSMHFSRRVASEQSYSRLDAPLGLARDVDVEILWYLTTQILGAIETNVDNVDGSRIYSQWYRLYFTSPDVIQSNCREVLEFFPLLNPNEFSEQWGTFLMMLLNTFLAGMFDLAAALMDAGMTVLRKRNRSSFTGEEESVLSDVIRLLSTAFATTTQFVEWQQTAVHYVADARYVLQHNVSGDDENHMATKQFCELALNILLMMSGDVTLIVEACNDAQMNALGFTCAVCCISSPFSSLQEVSQLLKNAIPKIATPGPWFNKAVVDILISISPAEIIAAMKTLSDVTKEEFPTPTSTSDPTFLKVFCLRFMTAHIADVCLMNILPGPSAASTLFTRNALLVEYVSLFDKDPHCWCIALQYLAFSPLLDPRELQKRLHHVGVQLESNPSTRQGWGVFYRRYFDSNSGFQRDFRRHLTSVSEGSRMVGVWIQSIDKVCELENFNIYERIIRALWQNRRYAEALWEAVEQQQVGFVQHQIKNELLEDHSVSPSAAVLQIGEAVANGFVSLDCCPPGKLPMMLRACAALLDVVKDPDTSTASSSSSSLSSSSGTSKPPVFYQQVSPRQRLASIECILRSGILSTLHPRTALYTVEVSLLLLRSDDSLCETRVEHLIELNTAVNKLRLIKTPTLIAEDIQRVSLEIVQRLARGW